MLYNIIYITYIKLLYVLIALNCSCAIIANSGVTSARFIAQERALVEWSQLRLFKAKERRGYLQRIGSYKYSSSAAPHRLCQPR
jgi:hypothetical protein